MKLNNYGFGMKEMVILMTILLVFLLLAAYNVNRLYASIETTEKERNDTVNVIKKEPEKEPEKPVIQEKVNEEYYHQLETKFNDAISKYIKDYSYDMSKQILTISSDTLINLGYIDLVDQFGNKTCDGYGNVFYDKEQEDYVIKSYIRCSNYTSKGY